MNSPNSLSAGESSALGFLPERFEPLHRRIQRFVDDGQHAGVSLLLARNGKIADTFATGFRDRELGLPMSRDTIVRVYSMTKIVVSVAALTLLEEGKLGLLDPLTDYLPEFSDLQVLVGGTAENQELVPADKPLTIQHLFTHTSGMIMMLPMNSPAKFIVQSPKGTGRLWKRWSLSWRAYRRSGIPERALNTGYPPTFSVA